ncbi:acyltransferase domain-containing protein [Ditylenchus destructor]|nr:acyltransferase domain-containing protein [Ditylenchus destructor]
MFPKIDGIVFVVLLFFSSLLGSIFLLVPFLPLAYFVPRLFRFCADRLVGFWLIFPTSMIFFLFRVKITLTGDLIEHDKPAIIIMNHRTRLDWMFFWNALYKMNPWLLTSEKISLKASLKHIPGAGWAMGCGAYMFLNRSFENDKRVMALLLKYYKNSKGIYQVLFFPEGTDKSERTSAKSDTYADNNGLARYQYVLHPRTAGFNFIFNEMRKAGNLDNVYDVTVAYPDNIVQSEIDLVKNGAFPSSIHFDVKKYSINQILSSSSIQSVAGSDPVYDCSQWINNIWQQKEEQLRQFYSTDDKNQRRFTPHEGGYQWPDSINGVVYYYIAFFAWAILTVFWTYAMYHYFWVKIYVLASVSFYLFAEKISGGVGMLILEWFYGRNFFMHHE